MGSTFLTKAEAAEELGRSQRTVQEYVKLGFIRTERQGRKTMLNAQDVRELSVNLGKDMPPMNRKSFWLLQHKFSKLERDHATIKEKLGMNDVPFRPSPEEAVKLEAAARLDAQMNPMPYDMAEVWVTTILRIDERSFQSMTIEKPYQPFLTILLNLTKQIEADRMLPKSLGLQALRARVEMARRRIKEAMLVWYEMGQMRDVVLEDSPKAKLMRRRAEMEEQKSGRSRDKK